MKCEYCGKEFFSNYSNKKYCSNECYKEADKANKRMKYVWKSDRADACVFCGEPLGKGRVKYCSSFCARKDRNIKQGRISHSEILTKNCCVCGKEFETWRSRQQCCSEKCRNEYKRIREANRDRKEQERKKYLKKHPNARTAEERHKEHVEREKVKSAERERKKEDREKEKAERDAIKQAKKQANIDYWQNYEAEHECAICGCVFVAHYPLAKYCSKKCSRKVTRIRKRYEGITIDKDITVQKLAKRDHDKCQLCGLPVDWNDKHKTDKAVICGDMYPSVDHIIPISSGGLHAWNNVQLAHRICNTRKSNKVIS